MNLLEEQLVWAPMGPPSEAASIVSSARWNAILPSWVWHAVAVPGMSGGV